jgi:hypothetical protein
MASALFDEFRGFGMMLTDEEVETVNNWRAANNIEARIMPGESPGLTFHLEGYWDGLKFTRTVHRLYSRLGDTVP